MPESCFNLLAGGLINYNGAEAYFDIALLTISQTAYLGGDYQVGFR